MYKTHTTVHSGPKRWSKDLSLDEDKWEKKFTFLKTVCRETKLKEFQYKLIHRIVVTKKELYRYGIKKDDEYIQLFRERLSNKKRKSLRDNTERYYGLYCGEKDSFGHTFRECHFVKIFIQRVINWFNTENKIKLLQDFVDKMIIKWRIENAIKWT